MSNQGFNLQRRPLLVAGTLLAGFLSGCGTLPSTGSASNVDARDLKALDFARQSLPEKDGWGAAEGGVWGGSDAKPANIYTVKSRSELLAALAAGEAAGTVSAIPKIIFISGVIDMSVDARNQSVGEAFYRDPAFDFAAFIKAFDPAVWGKNAPTGPLEDARKRSAAKQKAQVIATVGSNTSLIGLDDKAKIINGGLIVLDAENVIVRNIQFEDAYDYFPAWDPKDNSSGEWNSEYDNLSLYNASNVWIDHCTFSDGARPDKLAKAALGRPMQHHDGLLDIIRGSNYVTVSHNIFKNHDKAILVGNSDNLRTDNGKLKVTFRHNVWENVSERSPRVRFGQVHIFNNVFRHTDKADYSIGYSLGVGIDSRVILQANMWSLPTGSKPDSVIRIFKGTHLLEFGNTLNGAAYSAKQTYPELKTDIGWSPQTASPVAEATEGLMQSVLREAGAGLYKLAS